MHRGFWQSLIGLACLALAGCQELIAEPPRLDSASLLARGKAVLDCREPCLAAWRLAQPQAAQLEASAQWRDLAAVVLRTGYRDDLSLYYLGRAAEGMGYLPAASNYYRQSVQLSGTATSCQYLSRQCGGIALPRSASLRLAALEPEFKPRQRPAVPTGRPEAPAPAPEEMAPSAQSETSMVTPVPVAKPPATEHPAASDYIEPPPAAR